MSKFNHEKIFWGAVEPGLVKHTRTGLLGHAIFKLLLQKEIKPGVHLFLESQFVIFVTVNKSLITVADFKHKLLTRFFLNKTAGMEDVLQSAFINLEEIS